MKDAARFALAIAAILLATALDAQQNRSSQASHEADDPPPTTDGDGYVSPPEASANHALIDDRTSGDEPSRWIADQTSP